MSGFRFSIAGFFLVLTALALGMGALVSQSTLAGSAAYTAFVGLLCIAVVGSALRPLPAKAFWLGLAAFGWTYWFVGFDTEPAQPRAGVFMYSPSSGPQRPSLIGRELLILLANRATASRTPGSKVMGQWRGGSYYSGTIDQVNGDQFLIVWDDGSAAQWTPTSQILPDSPTLLVAGHSLAGGLFALLGGVLSAVLFGAAKADPAKPPIKVD